MKYAHGRQKPCLCSRERCALQGKTRKGLSGKHTRAQPSFRRPPFSAEQFSGQLPPKEGNGGVQTLKALGRGGLSPLGPLPIRPRNPSRSAPNEQLAQANRPPRSQDEQLRGWQDKRMRGRKEGAWSRESGVGRGKTLGSRRRGGAELES